jgi:hypothetical protein
VGKLSMNSHISSTIIEVAKILLTEAYWKHILHCQKLWILVAYIF